MPNVFISYNRENEHIVKLLSQDIEGLGHTVWFDRKLSGGQSWWDQILTEIQATDIFVIALSPELLQSQACASEHQYASQLGKSVLPIQISDGISTNLIPSLISKLQIVDYRNQERDSILRLGHAFTKIPISPPLPTPMPPPPEVPLSYLGDLTEQIKSGSRLSYDRQSALLLDLKKALKTHDTKKDAEFLLNDFRSRRDLFESIADEIDYLLEDQDITKEPVDNRLKQQQDAVYKPTKTDKFFSRINALKKSNTILVSIGLLSTLIVGIFVWKLVGNNTDTNYIAKVTTSHTVEAISDQLYDQTYRMVYNGSDGLNVRTLPSTSDSNILATIHSQRAFLTSVSNEKKYDSGVPWIEIKATGWMVRKSNKYEYISFRGENSAVVLWDGNGNENDNFITMRFSPSLNSNRIAKVYTNTHVKVLQNNTERSREWIKVELRGWVALQSDAGLRLLEQTSN